jgi:cytochrome c
LLPPDFKGRKTDMPWHRRLAVFAASLATLASVAMPADAGGDPEKGASIFNKCRSCHRIGPGARNLVGPELNGTVGRKAGSIADYSYSSAVKNSGLTWDEATLTQWLRSPRALVPGTRMTFAGLSRDEDIANVIAYLRTFDAQGNAVAAAK